MKALQFDRIGSLDDLKIVDLPKPPSGEQGRGGGGGVELVLGVKFTS
jgi:hypothetical protein